VHIHTHLYPHELLGRGPASIVTCGDRTAQIITPDLNFGTCVVHTVSDVLAPIAVATRALAASPITVMEELKWSFGVGCCTGVCALHMELLLALGHQGLHCNGARGDAQKRFEVEQRVASPGQAVVAQQLQGSILALKCAVAVIWACINGAKPGKGVQKTNLLKAREHTSSVLP